MAKNSIFLVLLFLLSLLTGCGDNVRLKGKVVYSDDKSPVTAGMVCFETDTYLARGNIKPDGTFVMGSFENNDGLPPGKYRIRVVGAIKVIGQNKDGNDIYEPLIAQKFTSASTSGITFDVTPSAKYFEVVVDRFEPKQKPLRK